MYFSFWGLIKDLSKFLNYLRPVSEGFTNNVGGDSVYISGNMNEVYNMLFKRAQPEHSPKYTKQRIIDIY